MNSQINFATVSESIWAFWDSLSSVQQSQLAHLKRYYELLTGDPDFSEKVKTLGLAPAAAEHGCFLDMDLVKPLWDSASRENFAPEKWPLFDLYRRFGEVRLLARDNMVKVGDPGVTNRRFSKWRERQIKRVKFETADSTSSVVHPIAAFELSEGCTMGCWFCGVSAAKFAGYVPYDCETETLWRGMLGVMQEKFGSAAGSAFCYWATDPMDNPDYFKYISAFSDIIGSVPQTTTAAALRDVDKIREILRFSAERRSIVNRFSVLTTKQLRGIWAEFPAEEIVHVELVMQNKGASTKKRAAGGALKRRNRQSEVKGAEENKDFVSGSIACVTGFLINLKLKRIQLVSPALPSADIPDGYIIFDELFFRDVVSFSDCVDQLMTKFMPEKISSTDFIEFHPHVTVEPVNEGFAIFNDLNEIQFPKFGNLAKIIGEGGHRVNAIVKLASDEGVEPLAALGFVNSAFKSGLLNERLLQSACE